MLGVFSVVRLEQVEWCEMRSKQKAWVAATSGHHTSESVSTKGGMCSTGNDPRRPTGEQDKNMSTFI